MREGGRKGQKKRRERVERWKGRKKERKDEKVGKLIQTTILVSETSIYRDCRGRLFTIIKRIKDTCSQTILLSHFMLVGSYENLLTRSWGGGMGRLGF